MSEKYERHGDASAVFDCLKYHASAGGEYEYRGTLALEAFDRICTTLLALKAQRDELLAAAKAAYEVLIQERDHIPMTLRLVMPNGAIKRLRAAIANAEKEAGE